MLFLTFFIIAFSFLVAGTFVLSSLLKKQEEEIGQRAMLIARTVSNLPEIKSLLLKVDLEESYDRIDKVVEEIRFINDLEYIVVMNMERRRFSHPSKEAIGQISQSTDMNAAFAQHYYLSKAEGESGGMIRAFVPIMNEENNQIGVTLVGNKIPTLTQVFHDFRSEILITIGLSIFFCIWGALTLGRHIKREMFGMEPHEISQMYVERTETFNAMHDGIIAVNSKLHITIFNKNAAEILGVREDQNTLIGKYIYDVFPDTRLPEIVTKGEPVYNQEIYVNGHSILSNRVPIYVNGKLVGAVAIFKDLTEFKQLAEELTGVKAFVQALRVHTHEYKNKLHTIAGLLHLGHTKQAIEYISQVRDEQENVTKFLNERIYNENISGLLLSKIIRGKELGITVAIDEESRFSVFPRKLDHHDFVVLFGNLIENAFEALIQVNKEQKEVTISIDDQEDILAIMISDNGVGMSEETIEHIFEHGFSTKEKNNRGIGLYLIKEIVDKGNGTIVVNSKVNIGTTFIITFEL